MSHPLQQEEGIAHTFLKYKRGLSNLNSLLFPWSQQALNPCENHFLFVKWHGGLLPFNTWDSVTSQGQGV